MKISYLKTKCNYAVLLVLQFFIFSHSLNAIASTTVTIRGTIHELNNGDTVTLIRYKFQFLGTLPYTQIKSYAIAKNKSFYFTTDLSDRIESCQIFFPNRLAHLNWGYGLLEAGHDLRISVKNNRLNFSDVGQNLIKYNTLLDSIFSSCMAKIDRKGKSMNSNVRMVKAAIAKIEKAKLTSSDNKNKAFSILRLEKSLSLISLLYSIANITNGPAKEFMRSVDHDIHEKYLKRIFSDQDVILVPSGSFTGLVRSRYTCLFENKIHEAATSSKLEKYNTYIKYLKENFKDPQLAQLLAAFIFANKNSDILTKNLIESSIKGSNFSRYNSIIQNAGTYLPGTLLPEFSLLDTLGNEVHLSKFKGNVLILDFWYTGCLACAISHKTVEPIVKSFEGKPVKLISISIDRVRNAWIKSIHSGLYTSLSDINLYTGKEGQNHAVTKYFQISHFPTFIIIDGGGKIIGSPKAPNQDNGDDLKYKIQQALSEGF
jgi:cytochrome oxidase Cu insertion factor (SCO1/SenC/PrrC family)